MNLRPGQVLHADSGSHPWYKMAEASVEAGSKNMTKSFVLMNVPHLEDKHECLSYYLETTLPELEVLHLYFHPGIPDRVLVVLKEEIDLNVARDSIYQEPLEGHYLRLQSAQTTSAVIVKGDTHVQKLPLIFIKHFYQSKFGGRKEIVVTCVHQIPQSSEIAVFFTNAEVTREVLKCSILMVLPMPGYKIEVKPFFANFHGLIPCGSKTFLDVLEENSHSRLQSQNSSFHLSSPKAQEVARSFVKNQPHIDMDMTSGHDSRQEKEKPIIKRNKTNIPFSKNQTSDFPEEASNADSTLENATMGKNFSFRDDGQGHMEHLEMTSDPKSVDKKSPDRQQSFHSPNHQTQATVPVARFLSLQTNASHTETKADCPEVTLRAKPDEITKKKGEDIIWLTLEKVMWKLLKDEIKEENNEMTYDNEREILLVKGKNIGCFMKSFAELKGRVKECCIPLDENQQRVLNSPSTKGNILSKLMHVDWIIDDGYIHIYGLNETSFDFAQGKVNDIIENFEGTSISITSHISSDELVSFKSFCEKYHPVHISTDDNSVTISGKGDSVREVRAHFDGMSNERLQQELEKQSKQSSVEFSETHYNLLMAFHKEELADRMKSVKYAWQPEQEGRRVIEFTGNPTDVKKVKANLMDIHSSIQTETIDVLTELGSTKNSLLVQKLSNLNEYDGLFFGRKSFEKDYKCIIKYDVITETSSQARGSTQNPEIGPETSLPTDVNSERQKCSFRIFSSIQLEIKNYGNIAEERPDVLVCFSSQLKKLAAYVGQAFSKSIPGLEDKVNNLPFSDNKVAFTELPFPGNMRVNLAVVILPMSPDKKSFKQGIEEVLNRAYRLGAHSVCFHLFGMTYPEDFISENFFSALQGAATVLTKTSLQKLTFMATSQDLYERMTLDVRVYFSLISSDPDSREFDEACSTVDEKENGNFVSQEKKVKIQILHRKSHAIASLWKTSLETLMGGNHET